MIENLFWSKGSLKFLKKHPLEAIRFRDSFRELSRDWDSCLKFDITPMRGWEPNKENFEVLRLRIGKYRAIFEKSPNSEIIFIYVIDIDSRGGIYK